MATSQNNNLNKNETLWINDPSIFFQTSKLLEVWPKEYMNHEQKINAISRCVIYLTLIGGIFFKNIKIFVSGIVTLVVLVITYYILKKRSKEFMYNKIKEGFSDQDLYEKYKHNFTNPTTQNPNMNVLLPEIQDNPHRQAAAPSYNKAVEEEINESVKNIVRKNFNDENIDEKLFKDIGDKLPFEQSMRQFYTNPNTLVPNNQKEFAQFCYGNMASCKDGDIEMCLKSAPRHTNR